MKGPESADRGARHLLGSEVPKQKRRRRLAVGARNPSDGKIARRVPLKELCQVGGGDAAVRDDEAGEAVRVPRRIDDRAGRTRGRNPIEERMSVNPGAANRAEQIARRYETGVDSKLRESGRWSTLPFHVEARCEEPSLHVGATDHLLRPARSSRPGNPVETRLSVE